MQLKFVFKNKKNIYFLTVFLINSTLQNIFSLWFYSINFMYMVFVARSNILIDIHLLTISDTYLVIINDFFFIYLHAWFLIYLIRFVHKLFDLHLIFFYVRQILKKPICSIFLLEKISGLRWSAIQVAS
jgi:hypothetical protein